MFPLVRLVRHVSSHSRCAELGRFAHVGSSASSPALGCASGAEVSVGRLWEFGQYFVNGRWYDMNVVFDAPHLKEHLADFDKGIKCLPVIACSKEIN